MNDEIMVSVLCLAYNHEPYIRQCLEGFVNQKTNFKFEVLIHDDASTDKTADIIREYEAKYPEIIKPIYQSENQWSKGISDITGTYNISRAQGKYLAWCEGDDYWCDENKLQIQFDYMEAHPDCTLCVHQAYKMNLRDNIKEFYSAFDEDGIIPVEKILEEGAIFATNSCFVKREVHVSMPDFFKKYAFGDHQIIIYNTLQGYCYYFAKPMSVYNWATEGSWTQRVLFNPEKRIKNCLEMIALMKRIDVYTEYQYHESLQKKIEKTQFAYHLAHGDFIELRKKKYKKYYDEKTWNPSKEALLNRIHSFKNRFHSG